MGIDVVTLALAKGYTDEKIRDAAFGDIPLDTTLTQTGQAADAKAVGDKFDLLSEEMLTQETDPPSQPGPSSQISPLTPPPKSGRCRIPTHCPLPPRPLWAASRQQRRLRT